MTDQPNTDTTADTTPPAADTDKPADQLGEPGRKALENERQARQVAEKRATELEQRLAKIESDQARARIAADRGLSAEQAELLQGSSEEELTAHADRILAAFAKDDEPRRRPRERLRSGAVPDSEPEDYASVADRVMRGR